MLVHNGGVILPADRLRAAGVDPSVLSTNPLPSGAEAAVRRVCDDLATQARAALGELRSQWHAIDRRWRLALLPLAMVEPYLRAQSSRQSVLETRDISPIRRVARIGMARLVGRV